MNPFASLESILSPQGEPEAPSIGLLVEDWDENLRHDVQQIVDTGYQVVVIPTGTTSMESDDEEQMGTGEPVSTIELDHHEPQVLFYYKGKPENAAEGIPVLIVEEGKVKVDMEGRVKELAEHLGLLDEEFDYVDRC